MSPNAFKYFANLCSITHCPHPQASTCRSQLRASPHHWRAWCINDQNIYIYISEYIYTIINLFQPSAKLLFLHNFAGFVRSSGHFWDQALLMQAIAHFHWWNIMGAVQVDTSGTPNKAQQVKLRSSLAQHYQHLNAKVPGLLPSAGTGSRAAGEGNFSMAGACCRSQGLVPTHVQEIHGNPIHILYIYIC